VASGRQSLVVVIALSSVQCSDAVGVAADLNCRRLTFVRTGETWSNCENEAS